MDEKKLSNLVGEYQELIKEDKNINVAALMENALANANSNSLSSGIKRWSYMLSLFAPPLGYLIAVWLYFKSEDDAKRVALYCIIFTTISMLGTYLLFKALLSGAGVSPQQIEQIKPQDVLQLTQ